MTYSISDRLLHREITESYKPFSLGRRKRLANQGISTHKYSSVRGLYGDKAWVDDLDIVNELGGHTGCVNALSWSKSGRLLASGSDDTHINIHTYQAEKSTAPFSLATTIQTGHEANIFSVKFMPHSNDSTIVSCAGDCQVRVFDIEHSASRATPNQAFSSSTRHTSGVNLDEFYRGVQYLYTGNTNARVYRSHSDRVKRIVTESSPHLFLTCSEDGEVRQWDLRLPSSAYPPHSRRGGQGSPAPPPLISYKRFQLDLNTISCSGSQPHYIVLGGAHLHAFLHDRRMLGRDVDAERGSPSAFSSSGSEHDEDLMSKATKCVRRFAPNGQAKISKLESGHITACKISDAHPNEMVGSWSGDHIYSFNLVSSPDALDSKATESNVVADGNDAKKTKPTLDKKRKREVGPAEASSSNSAEVPAQSELRSRSSRSSSAEDELEGNVALRVRYGNGQSEDILLSHPLITPPSPQTSQLTQRQDRSLRFAQSVKKIRRALFSSLLRNSDRAHLSEALGQIAALLPEMEEASSEWDTNSREVRENSALDGNSFMRRGRQIICLYLQACGTVSRLLGGTLNTVDPIQTQNLMARYSKLEIPYNIGLSEWDMFCFQLLACIIAWLDRGRAGLLAYAKTSSLLGHPISVDSDAGQEAIEEKLIPYLLNLAVAGRDKRSLNNLETNRFETDERRLLFSDSRSAVTQFAAAIVETHSEPSESVKTNRRAEWGFKVARSVLFAAAQHTNVSFVKYVFSGPRNREGSDEETSRQGIESNDRNNIESLNHQPNNDEASVTNASSDRPAEEGARILSSDAYDSIIYGPDFRAALRDHGIEVFDEESDFGGEVRDLETQDFAMQDESDPLISDEEGFQHDSEDDEHLPEVQSESGEEDYEDDDDEDDDDNDDEYNEDDDDDDDDDDDEDLIGHINPQTFIDASMAYARNRETVEADVPCSTHTRTYVGHCNVKTVKDVNFYGPDDEYVVSGSDSGHLFIWDRKTGKLLNVLQGDGEVVNVIQGHPYEPMLAVSGIDHTIKIFSPDTHAQERARHGLDLGTSTHRSHGVSRLQMRSRIRRHVDRRHPDAESRGGSGVHTPNTADPAADAASATAAWDDDDDFDLDNERPTNGGLASCKRMQDSYSIMSQNEADRDGGMGDAVITRSLLEQFANHIQARRAGRARPGGDDGDGCSVM